MRATASASVTAIAMLVTVQCREPSRQTDQVPSAFTVADSLARDGRNKESTPRYRALRDSFAIVHDTASWWRAQLWMAEGLLFLGKNDSAETELAKAAALAKGDVNRVGWTRYVRGIFMDRRGHFDSAMTEISSAGAIARETHDAKLEARAYHVMARIQSLTGRHRDALANNQRALQIENSYGAGLRETSLELSEIGIDYRHLGRFSDAVVAYDSALRIARKLRNPEAIARVEFNLGTIWAESGEADEALPLFNDALARIEVIGDVRGVALVHGGLADLYFHARAYEPAREHYERALAINRGARLPYGQVQNLEGIGRVDLAEGLARHARSTLNAALAIADSAPYGQERASTRAALARVSAAAGSPGEALKWARQAVQIADSLGDPASQLEARAALGVALEAARDATASTAYLSGIDLLEQWRGRLALGDLRMGVADLHLEVYEGAIRSLLRRGRAEEAFQVAERARARLLLELMAQRDSRNPLRSREDTLRQALREAFAGREDARGGAVSVIDQQIDNLTRALDSLESAARTNDVRAGVNYPSSASIAELRSSLLSPERGLLMFFWGERDVYGWWMTREGLRSARLGSADSLSAMVEFLRGALAAPERGVAWEPAARRAFERFVAPLAPAAKSEVLVVADGPLAYIPLETFIWNGDRPWGANTRFVYGPSASVLLALQRSPPTSHWVRSILAVGDPARLPDPTSTPGLASERSADDQLPDLPAAAAEARNIAAVLAGDAITGKQATLGRWLSLDPARYRYLHFATHTLFNDEHPQRTALLMADGRLDLDGVRRLQLSSDLVTLSGCETALGKQLRGEGVIGLPHAFLEAGAHGVVMSLWRVRDQAAARYMEEFYRNLRAGSSPAAAMLAIRRERLAHGGTGARPSDWAPFVLVGGFDTSRASGQ